MTTTQTDTTPYVPKGAKLMNDYPSTPRRLLLLGLPGVGKTFSALTFPNPIVADLDNKLIGFRNTHPEVSFYALPFWNVDFCVNTCKCVNDENKKNNPSYPPNSRDAFKYWLIEEGPKIPKDHTFILDSWTSLQSAFDVQSQLPHEVTLSQNTGKPDTFAFWARKKKFSRDVVESLKSLQCNVVVICHETYERNEGGVIVGVKPLQEGSYADELPSCFTDVYRQRVLSKKDAADAGLKWATGEQNYVWITDKDSRFQIACKSNPKLASIVPATYESLK